MDGTFAAFDQGLVNLSNAALQFGTSYGQTWAKNQALEQQYEFELMKIGKLAELRSKYPTQTAINPIYLILAAGVVAVLLIR